MPDEPGGAIAGTAPASDPVSTASASGSSSSSGAGAIALVAERVVPALIAKLSASDLGELEVSESGWRVRLRKDLSAGAPGDGGARSGSGGRGAATHGAGAHAGHVGGAATGSASAGSSGAAGTGAGAAGRSAVVRRAAESPAVGYFTPRDGLATGQAVRSGDVLGTVNVLGVPQQVVAPGDGVVGRLLAAAGEAVEYGQELVRIDGIERAVDG
ncbi:MAG: hypothetical protein QOH61_68 [Chloroflexota bacterium]|jgi:biotin carboxyl carrier protein|nr:hypothetical protein [Chloroflexota bacterium]